MNSAATDQNLGTIIKQAREAKKLSLRQAADLSHVPRTTIERIENGFSRRPRPDILHALGQALEISVTDLYALVKYPSADALPSFAPYLRARYQGLSPKAVKELEDYFERLAKREGIPLDGPAPGQDEK